MNSPTIEIVVVTWCFRQEIGSLILIDSQIARLLMMLCISQGTYSIIMYAHYEDHSCVPAVLYEYELAIFSYQCLPLSHSPLHLH